LMVTDHRPLWADFKIGIDDHKSGTYLCNHLLRVVSS
jgi:hypothetical protein